MMHLGPTGRTKHTEDWQPVNPTVVAVRELKEARRALRVLKWAVIIGVMAAAVWVIGTSVVDLVQAPERERRVRACAVAMEHQEHLRGPVPECEPLSASERREAAYEYGRMRGLW